MNTSMHFHTFAVDQPSNDRKTTSPFFRFVLACLLACVGLNTYAEDVQREYQLAEGDSIKVTVFQNTDLTLETRVSENGSITFPLIGKIQIGGLPIAAAEQKIAAALQDGGFMKGPQVNIVVLQIVGNQVSVLGQVAKPGSYPLKTSNTRISQLLATAGGIASSGGSLVVLSGTRNHQTFRKQIDLDTIYQDGKTEEDVVLEAGDSLFVPKAPMFYIYGEAQRAGAYPLERHMTVRQALAIGGGLTPRGTERGLTIKRQVGENISIVKPDLDDVLQAGDVLFVKESLF